MVAFQSFATRELATLSRIKETALSRLDPQVADFLEGGAGDEWTMNENRRAFQQWAFAQRTMSGLGAPDLRTSFLGLNMAMPVLTAPFGADRLFHPDGQLAVARANAEAGLISIAPEAGSHSIEEIAAAAPAAARIAQLHPSGTEENVGKMVRRAEEAGYQVICVTCDCPTGGWRERIIANEFDLDDAYVAGNYPPGSEIELSEVFGQLFERGTTVWSWERLGTVMSQTSLPWIAKGIMSPSDAQAALAAGASAIYVSNHGGRQLDGVPSALSALVRIRAAIGPDIPVVLDSGIRRGADIVKALALGADVVVIGRLAVYGLAAAGQAGVTRVHTLLHDEIRTILTLLGHGGVSDLGPDSIVEVPR